MSLTDKQAAFVMEYCVDKNATQAAIRAGYSAKTAYSIGEENLRKPEIRDAVEKALAQIAKTTETEAEWVRRRLKEEADNYDEEATHSGRIKALELVGKINGMFIDRKEVRTGSLDELPHAEKVVALDVVKQEIAKRKQLAQIH